MNHPRDYFEPTTFSSICYATFSWSPQSNSILMVRPLLSRTLAVRYFQALFLWCLKKCDITSYYYWSAPYKLFSVPILCQMLTYGRRIPIPELFARIDAVDASTVKRVANRFIFDQVLFCQPVAFHYVEFTAFSKTVCYASINALTHFIVVCSEPSFSLGEPSFYFSWFVHVYYEAYATIVSLFVLLYL